MDPVISEILKRMVREPDHKDPYVTDLLNRMAKLYAERNAVYKDNYLKVGRVMDALFPDGMMLQGPDAFNRWHLLELAIVKLTRYATQYEAGGHTDSLEDMIVYLAMVAGLDDKAANDEPEDENPYDTASKEPDSVLVNQAIMRFLRQFPAKEG